MEYGVGSGVGEGRSEVEPILRGLHMLKVNFVVSLVGLGVGFGSAFGFKPDLEYKEAGCSNVRGYVPVRVPCLITLSYRPRFSHHVPTRT